MITRAESFIKRIQTTNQEKPVSPDLTFHNGRNKDILLLNIGVVPNIDFLIKGHLTIRIDGEPTNLEIIPNDLLDVKEFNTNYSLSGGLLFKRNTHLEVYAWNEVDGQLIAITISLLLGEM